MSKKKNTTDINLIHYAQNDPIKNNIYGHHKADPIVILVMKTLRNILKKYQCFWVFHHYLQQNNIESL